MKFPASTSHDENRWILHQERNYLILDETLYHRGVDCILRRCLIHKEAELILNDYHTGACGGHFSGLETTQNILWAGYFWPTLIIFHWFGQEVPPVSDLLSKYEGTSCSHVSLHFHWSLHQVGDWFYYMPPGFSQGASLYHHSGKLLHKVGRGYANI